MKHETLPATTSFGLGTGHGTAPELPLINASCMSHHDAYALPIRFCIQKGCSRKAQGVEASFCILGNLGAGS
jgi:hypothetical protein